MQGDEKDQESIAGHRRYDHDREQRHLQHTRETRRAVYGACREVQIGRNDGEQDSEQPPVHVNGSTANATQTPPGIIFDERPSIAALLGQPFVIGNRTQGLDAAEITAAFSLPADAPGVAGQWKQLDLAFAPGSFRSGDRLAFGVDRDETDQAGTLNGAAGGNSADLLGDGVSIPSGQIVSSGARFFGNFQGGQPFQGRFFNLIGKGYSQLDGFGFVNAEAAVKAVTKNKKH